MFLADSSDNECIPVTSKGSSLTLKSLKGQYQRKESSSKEEEATRTKNRIKSHLSRKRQALYKQLVCLKMHTGWEGIILLRSKDKKTVVYGGNDEELLEAFTAGKPLCPEVMVKTCVKKVNMANIARKVASSSKHRNIVSESLDPVHSECPDHSNRETIMDVTPIDVTDDPAVRPKKSRQVNMFLTNGRSAHQPQSPIALFTKKRKTNGRMF